jgi:Sec-independent protein secretion pathway component TatC
MPTFREPPSFPEWFGARLASRLLWVICGLAVVFLVVWWATRPTLVEVRQWLGVNVASQELLTHARNLQQDHFDQFRDLFQLIVMSGLIPLFTLLAGYAFGARQREKQE